MPLLSFQPSGRTHRVPRGTNLLDACHQAGVGVPASCGGKGLCGKCRVRILDGDVPEAAGSAQALSPAEVELGWHLACQVTVESDLVVDTSEAVSVESLAISDFAGRSPTVKTYLHAESLTLAAPTLDDQRCDWERVSEALTSDVRATGSLAMLQQLPAILRQADWQVTVIMHADEVINVEAQHDDINLLGLAVDIGTTTLAVALYEMETGQVLQTSACTNPQARAGDDVVSRIGHAAESQANRRELQETVIEAIQQLMTSVCISAEQPVERVYCISFAGNTTMHHLALGIDPNAIAASPFIPGTCRGHELPARELGLRAGNGAHVYAMPNISAYVGADIVAGILAHEIHTLDGNHLLVDVGTNGEIALRSGGRTYACATAAGPAFEGARISCGMRAADGAISEVARGDDDIHVTTINDRPARGLCGTGLLDAVAVLLDLGLITDTGRLLSPDEAAACDLPAAITARVVEDDKGQGFVLAEGHNGLPRIVLRPRDVRELQLAKGAVHAGITVLLDLVELATGDLDTLYLAGGFGRFLRPESATRVGLLPPALPVDRIKPIGNASLAGARLCLLNLDERREAERIAREVDYIELSGKLEFQQAFTDSMIF